MKVVNAFVNLFAIFTFLTLGSLLVIVALHILSVDDAIFKIREIYENPLKSLQIGFVGLVFILVGLSFSKILVKKGRDSEAVIFQSEVGPMIVSVTAMEDVVKKVLKRFHVVKEWKVKTVIRNKDVEFKLRLKMWAGSDIPRILAEIQEEISGRIRKLLSPESKVEVSCDVHHIEDHEATQEGLDAEKDKAISL